MCQLNHGNSLYPDPPASTVRGAGTARTVAPSWLLHCLLGLLIICGSWPAPAAAQLATDRELTAPTTNTPAATDRPATADEAAGDATQWYFGYELFQMLLEERGLRLLSSLDDALRQPQQTVIVLQGLQRPLSQRDWQQLQRFCLQGGAVLLTSDQTVTTVGFHAGPVTTRQAAQQYQNFSDCLRISALDGSHPLTSGLREIIANRCGWLTPPRDSAITWNIVASLPERCEPAGSSGQALLVAGHSTEDPRGVLLLAADQSLLTNNMLWHGDNALLAIQVSNLLCAGSRSQLLFLTDGQPAGSYRDSPLLQNPQSAAAPFTPPATPPDLPEPKLETMLRLANSVISNVQESDILNETLARQPRRVRLPQYQRILLLALAGTAVWLLLWLLSRNAPSPWLMRRQPPRPMAAAYLPKSSGTASTTDYSAAGRTLAADFCRELTGSARPADWQPLLQAAPSSTAGTAPLELTGRSERQQLQTIVDLATNGRQVHLSRGGLESLGRSIHELRNRVRGVQTATTASAANKGDS